MKKTISLIITILLIISVAFLVIKKTNQPNENLKLQVSTSFYPMYFFASLIGRDKVNVVNITPAGAEPHDYDPTPQDIIKIQNSKLLILNGSVETWANKIKTNLNEKSTQILVAGENLENQKIEENGAMTTDPHVWLSPHLAKIESQKIEKKLEDINPVNSDYYKSNLMKLEMDLDQIDQNYKIGLQNCQLKSFITSHAAFVYLSKDYGLTQNAIDGLSPDAEPSLKELAQIADFTKKNNIKIIFFEALVSPKLSQTIADEAGAKTLVLDPIEGISDKDLSKDTTYLTLMTNNLQNLRTALQCK